MERIFCSNTQKNGEDISFKQPNISFKHTKQMERIFLSNTGNQWRGYFFQTHGTNGEDIWFKHTEQMERIFGSNTRNKWRRFWFKHTEQMKGIFGSNTRSKWRGYLVQTHGASEEDIWFKHTEQMERIFGSRIGVANEGKKEVRGT